MLAFTGGTGGTKSTPGFSTTGDFSSQLTSSVGQLSTHIGSSRGIDGNELASATGALAGGLAGSAFGIPPELGGKIGGWLGSFFGGKKTDEAAQSTAINTIAAAYKISGAEAGAVIANHANNSSDHFDDLAKSVAAADGLRRFPELLAEYNSAHPGATIRIGSLEVAAQAQASQQQKLITTALTTSNFASTASGKEFVFALQSLPASQAVGTQGQTVGDILDAILNGASKGAGDAVAETAWGKKFKWSYIKDWLKENQLLAFGLAIIAALGITTIVNIFKGKHGKISI